MTDSRTTELLRELRRTLEKCRRTEEAGFDTYWITAVALDTSLDELEQAIAATMGGGELTAEQVRKAIMSADRWEKPMGDTGMTNTHLIIRDDGWQAIADELNAELGSGTCECVKGKCSNCGKDLPEDPYSDYEGNFCPSCGARIRKAVKR